MTGNGSRSEQHEYNIEKAGIAVRLHGFKKKLYLLTYDKPDFQKKALQMKRSLEEVKRILNKKGVG